jgi:enamine deaminase RidA (YjgF/YER057c/UK114 family)
MNENQKIQIKGAQRREAVVPKDMKDIPQKFHYSPGVKAGPFLFIAGQVGRDGNMQVIENKEAQMAQAFENVKKVLTEAGLSFDDIVDMVTYLTDMRDLQLLMKVKDLYFTNLERLPTWTAIGSTVLANPGLFVEVKCTALLPE